MAFRVRSSKFRHVYGDPHRKEKCYECVKISKNAHDGSFCSVNPKFLAYVTESAGGGSFAVLPLQKTGRVDVNTPKVCGHVGPVLDIKWSPFDDHIIASCSDDATIKVWQIPENGVKGNLSDWLVDLHGHQRRVAYLEWHPTAENILLSAGHDHQCILWNTETAEPVNIIDVHTETVFSITWNYEGSLFATTSKDKKIRVIDPRLGETCAETQGHIGPKASKAVFLGDTQKLFTTGFTRLSERQYAVWDIKNMSKPLKLDTIDSSSGVLFPYYDHDTGVIFVAGKGDGNIRYYELVKDHPYIHYLSQFQSPHPQRALGIMPKRGIDPYRCEIVRFYKIHTVKNLIEPISMIVPRKSEMFQDDLFPPTASATPSLSADEWISGQNREPILVSMKDGQIVSAPKTTPSKAVQHKDGTLTHAPSITTYKAVRRNITPSTNSAEVRAPVKKTQPEKLPASVRNIAKLSTENEADKKVNSFESSELQGLESKRVTKNAMIQKQNEPVRVDMKVWAPSIGDADAKVIRNGSPNTDPEFIATTVSHPDHDPLTSSECGYPSSPDSRLASLPEENAESKPDVAPCALNIDVLDAYTPQVIVTAETDLNGANQDISQEDMADNDMDTNLKPSDIRSSREWYVKQNSDQPGSVTPFKDPTLEKLRSANGRVSPVESQGSNNLGILFDDVHMDTPENSLIRPSKLRESLRKKKRQHVNGTSSHEPGLGHKRTQLQMNSATKSSVNTHNVNPLETPTAVRNLDTELGTASPQDEPSTASSTSSSPVTPEPKRSRSADFGKVAVESIDIEMDATSDRQDSVCGRSEIPDLITEPQSSPTEHRDPKIHVKKVWALPCDDQDCSPGQVNGKEPTTDADLRKAYFRQLEEIKSLKEQIILKDKRIRQLETEMQILKNIQENGESHC